MVAVILAATCCTCQQAQAPSEFDLAEPNEQGGDAGQPNRTGTDTSEQTDETNSETGPSAEDEREHEKPDPDPIDWGTDPSEPAEIHPKAERHAAGTFDWAPDDREVVLHTYAESEATRSEWERLVGHLDSDHGEKVDADSVGERRAFGLIVDAPLYVEEDITLEDRYGDVGHELEPGETIYWGLGGPFARHRVHLFECGPADNEEGPTRAWRVGNVVVRCDYNYRDHERRPNLRYGVALAPDVERSGEESELVVEKHNCDRDDEKRRYTLMHTIVTFPPEPAVPDVYLEWWRKLREAGRRAWESMPEDRLTFDRREFKRMDAFVFDTSRGIRASRLAYLDFEQTKVRGIGHVPEVTKRCQNKEKRQALIDRCGAVQQDCIASDPGPEVMTRPPEGTFIFTYAL